MSRSYFENILDHDSAKKLVHGPPVTQTSIIVHQATDYPTGREKHVCLVRRKPTQGSFDSCGFSLSIKFFSSPHRQENESPFLRFTSLVQDEIRRKQIEAVYPFFQAFSVQNHVNVHPLENADHPVGRHTSYLSAPFTVSVHVLSCNLYIGEQHTVLPNHLQSKFFR